MLQLLNNMTILLSTKQQQEHYIRRDKHNFNVNYYTLTIETLTQFMVLLFALKEHTKDSYFAK